MKNKIILSILLVFTIFLFISCNTTPVPYSFEKVETENGTATIIFVPKPAKIGVVRLVDFEGIEIPPPEKGTHWEPVTFPAGKSLNLRVYVGWSGDNRGYRRRGIFKCPPLEAGKEYKLWFKKSGDDGSGTLILTDVKVKKLSYFLWSPLFKSVYEQRIPSL